MENKKQKFKELVYELMEGVIDVENCPVEESKYVENEYADGKECARLYNEVFDANRRICTRLGNPYGEDRDVELIINNLLDICRILSIKMYDYGQFFMAKEN